MKLVVTTIIKADVCTVWGLVTKSSTLEYVCRGLLGFKGVENFPDKWCEGDIIKTRLKLFSVIPAWKHNIQFKQVSNLRLITEEQGGIVKKWNHRIHIKPLTDAECQYTDYIEISAGVFTPVIFAFAYLFYRYRQCRWKQLIQINMMNLC